MQKWEYTTITLAMYEIETTGRMEDMGKEGWELVSIISEFTQHMLIFKRSIKIE